MRDDGAVPAPGQARDFAERDRWSRASASCSIASSGSPTNMPSTCAARAIDSRGRRRRMRSEAEHRRAVSLLQLRQWRRHLHRALASCVGKEDQRRREPRRDRVGRSTSVNRETFGRRIDQAHVAAGLAQQRRGERERVRRLGRAENVLALLAAALAGEGDAVDERRVDEQRAATKHRL